MVIQNKKLTWILFVAIAIVLVVIFTPQDDVYADMGPKPTVQVAVNGLPESNYAVTLITNQASPGASYTIYEENIFMLPTETELLLKRLREENTEYLLAGPIKTYMSSSSVGYLWTYYAPTQFEIVIYDLNNDILYRSNQIQKHVYTEVYIADYKDFEQIDENTYTFTPKGAIVYTTLDKRTLGETISIDLAMFILRIVLTIAIEILIALCFKFTKESYKIIAITNLITQVILNVVIGVWSLFGGALFGPFVGLIIGEFLVFIIEPIVYKKKCLRQDGTKKHIVFYAILANFITLAAGFGLNILEIYMFA